MLFTDQECVDYARECVRLAELTKDLQLRDWLLTTARVNIARLSDGIAALISREPSGDWELPQTKLGDTPIRRAVGSTDRETC